MSYQGDGLNGSGGSVAYSHALTGRWLAYGLFTAASMQGKANGRFGGNFSGGYMPLPQITVDQIVVDGKNSVYNLTAGLGYDLVGASKEGRWSVPVLFGLFGQSYKSDMSMIPNLDAPGAPYGYRHDRQAGPGGGYCGPKVPSLCRTYQPLTVWDLAGTYILDMKYKTRVVQERIKHMKKITALMATTAISLAVLSPLCASDIEKYSVSGADDFSNIRLSRDMDIPVPEPVASRASVVVDMGSQDPGTEYTNFAAAGKVPVALVDKMLRAACASASTEIKIVNPAKPMLTVNKNALKFSNYTLPLNLHPALYMKPYLAEKNTVALKISKVDFGISGFLLDALLKTLHLDGKEGLINEIGKITVDSVNKAMADFSAAHRPDGVPADENLLTLSYNNSDRTFYAVLSENFISALMPGYDLRGFYLTETDFLFSFGSRDTAGLILNRTHNIVIGDGDVTGILGRYSTPDMDLSSVYNGVAGGILFGRPARSQMSVSGKVNTGLTVPVAGWPLHVAFTAAMEPRMAGPNTVKVEIKKITINAVYAGTRRLPSIPDWVQNMERLQTAMIDQTISALMKAEELKPYVFIRRTGIDTLDLILRPDVFLPALAGWIDITGLEMGNRVLYLKYSAK